MLQYYFAQANTFNTMRRDILLQMLYDCIPEIYAFTHQA